MMQTIFQGEARDLVFAVTSATGALQDLTGAAVVWRLQRDQGTGSDSIIEKTAVVSNGESGLAVVPLDAQDTDLAPGFYFHELRISLNGAVATAFQGRISIARSLFV